MFMTVMINSKTCKILTYMYCVKNKSVISPASIHPFMSTFCTCMFTELRYASIGKQFRPIQIYIWKQRFGFSWQLMFLSISNHSSVLPRILGRPRGRIFPRHCRGTSAIGDSSPGKFFWLYPLKRYFLHSWDSKSRCKTYIYLNSQPENQWNFF